MRAGAEAAMREVIGKSNLQYAQTEGRSRIEQDTKDLLQRILDEYGLGVRISQVQLLRVDPPQEVIGAFRDVQAARADKEKSINEANTYRNQVLPRAKGEAEVDHPDGPRPTRPQIVARASGDAQRFDQVYDQYAKAKDITTERLYLETMEEVLRNVNKVLIDKNARAGRRALPAAARAEVEPRQTPAPLRRRDRPAPPPAQGAHAMSNRSIVALVVAGRRRLPGDPDLYTVDPTKQVLVRQFGAIVGEPKTEPGLYAKIPLVQDISAHRPPAARLRSRGVRDHRRRPEAPGGRRLCPLQDRRRPAVRRDACRAARPSLRGLLDSLINSEIRGVLSSVPLHAVLTEQRASLMDDITAPGERQDQGPRRRGGRRPHQARRSAAGQLPVGLQPHEDRPRARGRPAARRGRRGEASASPPLPTARSR